jgi:hypothetical protein
MGKHAVIGNSQVGHKNQTLKQANRFRTSHPTQYGRDVNLPGDRRGAAGFAVPVTSVYDISSPAYGTKFSSPTAQQIVTRGVWRKDDHGWVIATVKHGMLRVSKGIVLLNRDVLGYVDMTTLTSIAGRDNVVTMVIAGTVPQEMIKRDKAEKVAKVVKAYVGGLIEGARCMFTGEPANACYCCH